MPELRTDWLTGRTVVIAENRADRPNEFESDAAASSAGRTEASSCACPFCPGNESDTPPALYEQRDREGRWRVRVIANKYPALSHDVTSGAPSTEPRVPTMMEPIAKPAFGIHEVIVETARHIDRTSSLSESELRDVLNAYANRLCHWSKDRRLAYGLVFKNQGPRAGASLAHLHSQLIALPVVPATVDAELRRAAQFQAEHQSCAYCRLIRQERELGARVVCDDGDYFAFCPFVSVQPAEVWLMPASHEASFEKAMSAERLGRLSELLRKLVVGAESLIPSKSFNLLLRTAPWRGDHRDSFHWRIEIQPRMNAIAGLEAATGIYVNCIAPERAAARLRID